MSQQTCLPTDLVLLLSGDKRATELVTIKTQKCLLGMDDAIDGQPQCVIFRGPKGATLRSYNDGILVNEESKTVHWLKEGDRIQFPNSTVIEVQQLGLVAENPGDQNQIFDCDQDKPDSTNEHDSDGEFRALKHPQPTSAASGLPHQKIGELVAEISEIREKKKSGDHDIESLDRRLIELTEELTSLVETASSGPAAASTDTVRMPTETVSETHVRDSASTVQLDSSELLFGAQAKMESMMPSLFNHAEADAAPAIDEAIAVPEVLEPKQERNPEPVAESAPETESVADLLTRMKADGQWGGIPDDDETPATIETVADESPSVEIPAPKTDAESDVEDYMSQLLSRMRGGEEPRPTPVKSKAPMATKKEVPPKQVEVPLEPLRPEEFVPSRKAARIESLSAMRELANTTARSAVHSSEVQRLRALAYLQLGIAVASMIMSGYYFGLCSTMGNMGYVIGGTCVGITIFLGTRCYNTMFRQIPFSENPSDTSRVAKPQKA